MSGSLLPVSEAIRRLPSAHAEHPLEAYASAFRGFALKAHPWVNAGADSVVLELENDTVLKIGLRPIEDDMGTRPYDCPIREHGAAEANGVTCYWFIQPLCDDKWWEWGDFLEPIRSDLKSQGYYLWDASAKNFGRLDGRIVLIDPWAMRKL